VLLLHGYKNQVTVAGFADEASVVVIVGEDFEEEFDWKFENFPIQVRCGSKRRG
jgi:hypothetical protein